MEGYARSSKYPVATSLQSREVQGGLTMITCTAQPSMSVDAMRREGVVVDSKHNNNLSKSDQQMVDDTIDGTPLSTPTLAISCQKVCAKSIVCRSLIWLFSTTSDTSMKQKFDRCSKAVLGACQWACSICSSSRSLTSSQ